MTSAFSVILKFFHWSWFWCNYSLLFEPQTTRTSNGTVLWEYRGIFYIFTSLLLLQIGYVYGTKKKTTTTNTTHEHQATQLQWRPLLVPPRWDHNGFESDGIVEVARPRWHTVTAITRTATALRRTQCAIHLVRCLIYHLSSNSVII